MILGVLESSLTPAISEFLVGKDLEVLSVRDVRKHVEVQFALDFSADKEAKTQINELIRTIVRGDNAEPDEPDEPAPPPKPKRQRTARKPASAPPQRSPSTARELSEEDKKELETLRVMMELAEDGGLLERIKARRLYEDAYQAAHKRARTPLKKKQVRSANQKMMCLSDELGSVVGARKLTRQAIVKRIWIYIKALNLQDESDRRVINCDDMLFNLFKRKTVTAFSMNKFIQAHIKQESQLTDPVPDDGDALWKSALARLPEGVTFESSLEGEVEQEEEEEEGEEEEEEVVVVVEEEGMLPGKRVEIE